MWLTISIHICHYLAAGAKICRQYWFVYYCYWKSKTPVLAHVLISSTGNYGVILRGQYWTGNYWKSKIHYWSQHQCGHNLAVICAFIVCPDMSNFCTEMSFANDFVRSEKSPFLRGYSIRTISTIWLTLFLNPRKVN